MDRRIMIYCRISRDDGFTHYEKIETQRDILINYCRENNLGRISKIVLHDNVSGRDNSRFDYLKKSAEINNINCIVVKDLSRLGRDMIHVLDFINYLEERKIELLFSHETIDKEIYPLVSWFNQQRAKEDSRKIKKSMHFKMAEGDIVFKPPYGYKVNNKRLELDPRAAEDVREIFYLFELGYSIEEICNILKIAGRTDVKWHSAKILNILKNDFYCGTGKFGIHSEDDFEKPVIIEGHHMPIIKKEQFLQTGKIISQKKEHKRNERAEGIFSGIIYCGKCGGKMYLRKRNGVSFYICNTYNQKGKSACTMHKVSESELVLETQKYLFQSVEKCAEDNPEVKENEIKKNEKKLADYKRKLEILISDFEKDIIGKNFFEKKYKSIEMKMSKIENISEFYWNESFCKTNLPLKRGFIALLFEKIIVFEPGEIKDSISPNVSDAVFRSICQEGGIIFIENSIL